MNVTMDIKTLRDLEIVLREKDHATRECGYCGAERHQGENHKPDCRFLSAFHGLRAAVNSGNWVRGGL